MATLDRRADLGQLVIHHPYRIDPLPGNANYAPREDIRAMMKGRDVGGRLVQHRSRTKPLGSVERYAELGIKYIDHPMTGGNTVSRVSAPRSKYGHPVQMILDEAIQMGEEL